MSDVQIAAATGMSVQNMLWIGGIVVTNISAIVGGFISYAVKIGKLETRIEECEHDLDQAWAQIRYKNLDVK